MKSQCFLGTISTARRQQLCSIIRKHHLCACSRLRSRPLGKIGDEIAVLSSNHFYCQGPTAKFYNQETNLCTCARLSARSLGKIGAEITVFLGTISTARGPQICSIIRKLQLCACSRLSSRTLVKIGAEIAVLSWNNFY
jgi:hypothetical protein